MTRAMRERLAAKSRKQHRFARIRVRFPEGLTLQGVLLTHITAVLEERMQFRSFDRAAATAKGWTRLVLIVLVLRCCNHSHIAESDY